MNQYEMVFQYSNGYKDEVIVDAANRAMAFAIFEELGFEDVISVDCFRVID
jgi:hypothetical protein